MSDIKRALKLLEDYIGKDYDKALDEGDRTRMHECRNYYSLLAQACDELASLKESDSEYWNIDDED